MLPKLVFSSFKLCVLVVICTAAPTADSDLSSGSDNEGKIVKLKGGGADLSDLSSGNEDGENIKLQGAGANEGAINAEEKHDDPVAEDAENAENNRDNGVQDDNPDANQEPINTDEKDASVAEEPIDGEKDTHSGVQNDNPDANQETNDADEKDASVGEEPIDGEKNTYSGGQDDNPDANQEPINAGKKGIDPPIDDEKESAENKITEKHVNDMSDSEIPNPSSICYSGKNNVTYCNSMGFGLTPAEQIKFKIWPGGEIPYYIDELSYDKVLRDKIRSYLDEVSTLTLLRFEELPEPPAGDDERWVFFINRRGQLDCKDYNTNSFTITGVQKVIIGYNCLEHGGPMAAVVLALAGVPPQHNSPDRDRYITVMTDHIIPEKKGLFRRLKDSDWLFHDLKYDFESASHYLTHKYTADGSETIKILDEKERAKRISADLAPMELVPRGSNALLRLPFGDRLWTYNNEKRTYSSEDLTKLGFLYSHIVVRKRQIGIKPEDCKAMYRPGPSFSKMKLKQQTKFIAKKKPKKYVDAVGTETGPDKLLGKAVDIQGEALSSLE